MRHLRTLLPYYKPYWRGLVAGMLLVVVSNVFTIVGPFIVKLAIDGLTAEISTLSVEVNKTSDLVNTNRVLDFAGVSSRDVATGPAPAPVVTIDIDGGEGVLLSVATNIKLDVFGFVQLEGSLAFKKATGSFMLTDANTNTMLTGFIYSLPLGNLSDAIDVDRVAGLLDACQEYSLGHSTHDFVEQMNDLRSLLLQRLDNIHS